MTPEELMTAERMAEIEHLLAVDWPESGNIGIGADLYSAACELVLEVRRRQAEVEHLHTALQVAAYHLSTASHVMTETGQTMLANVYAQWAQEARKALEA